MSTESCLYEGTIRHVRLQPRREFRHRLALAYIDLDELPSLLDGRLLGPRPGLLRFRRRDYLGDSRVPLDRSVRDLVEEQTGRRPAGPVRILTQLRAFGHCFNPVSFYYCMNEHDARIDAFVAEVTNTPWGERHAYVVPAGSGRLQKALHVSPFLAMDHTYDCNATVPDSRLSVRIDNRRRGALVFAAGLALERRELTPGSVRGLLARYPFASARVLGLIYAHGLGLRLAGVRPFPRPRGMAA